MACYNLPTTNYISVAWKFLPSIKELFNKPPKAKKRRFRYVIYKRINTSYYGNKDDENGILEKIEWTTEEEMQARELRKW
jgi:pre-mRNA-splicing factor ISY1